MAQATLTVWKFDTAEGADEAAATLERLAERSSHRPRRGHGHLGGGQEEAEDPSAASTTGAGALGGAFWGMLFGLIFFVPLLGAAVGAATGALAGSLADVGIDDGFINKVRDQVTPGTSALFLMTPTR